MEEDNRRTGLLGHYDEIRKIERMRVEQQKRIRDNYAGTRRVKATSLPFSRRPAARR